MNGTSVVINYVICGIQTGSRSQWFPGTKAWHCGCGALTNRSTRLIFGDLTNYAHAVGAILLF